MPESLSRGGARKRSAIAGFMFASRWLQLPLYLGLILAQCVYVFHFWVELKDLMLAAMGNEDALQHPSTSCSCCRRWRSPAPTGS